LKKGAPHHVGCRAAHIAGAPAVVPEFANADTVHGRSGARFRVKLQIIMEQSAAKESQNEKIIG